MKMTKDQSSVTTLQAEIRTCRLCTDRFAVTATQHRPKPVVWFDANPRILIAGQAPGMRVHQSGVPFDDRSGDRLRDWLGLSSEEFYDRRRIAIVPMAFCFPGYNAAGSDLAPPKICGSTWHARVLAQLGDVPLTILVGGHAHRWHLGAKTNVTDTVKDWRDQAPRVFPLPHPSWRNTAWLNRNAWFAKEVLPALQHQVKEALK